MNPEREPDTSLDKMSRDTGISHCRVSSHRAAGYKDADEGGQQEFKRASSPELRLKKYDSLTIEGRSQSPSPLVIDRHQSFNFTSNASRRAVGYSEVSQEDAVDHEDGKTSPNLPISRRHSLPVKPKAPTKKLSFGRLGQPVQGELQPLTSPFELTLRRCSSECKQPLKKDYAIRQPIRNASREELIPMSSPAEMSLDQSTSSLTNEMRRLTPGLIKCNSDRQIRMADSEITLVRTRSREELDPCSSPGNLALDPSPPYTSPRSPALDRNHSWPRRLRRVTSSPRLFKPTHMSPTDDSPPSPTPSDVDHVEGSNPSSFLSNSSGSPCSDARPSMSPKPKLMPIKASPGGRRMLESMTPLRILPPCRSAS